MRRAVFSRSRRAEPAEEHDYWLSVSDLMAGLLMVFALMLLAALYQYQSGVEGIREILSIREEVVRQLQDQLRGESNIVEVDDNGTVRFRDNLLFAQGSSNVSSNGERQLQAFARLYLPVLLDNPRFRSQLRAIVIEGHTNDDGAYALNLRLSQDRAFAVMQVLLREAGGYEEDLQTLVSANGRSESELIYQEVDGARSVDKEASRRIEISLRLNDDELLLRVLDQVASQSGVS